MSTARTSYDQIKQWLDAPAMRERLERALPDGIPSAGWIEAALSTLALDEKLQQCTPLSILGSLFEVATLGLRIEGVLGQAYLEPRWTKPQRGQTGKGQYEATVQVGYRGLILLAYQSDANLQDIEATIVHKGDQFEFQRGSAPFLRHAWDIDRERGPMRAVYSGLRFLNGYYSFVPYSIEEVLSHRVAVLGQKGIRVEVDNDTGAERYFKLDYETKAPRLMRDDEVARLPWVAHAPAMVRKTAIKWSAKYWRLGFRFDRAAQLDTAAEIGEQNPEARARAVLPEAMAREVAQEASGAVFAVPAAPDTVVPAHPPVRPAGGLKERMLAGVKQGTPPKAPKSAPETLPEILDAPPSEE
jgi:phage RecT family recombinase